MKRVIAGTFVAAAFAVGLSAQSTPPQTPPQTPPRTPAPMQEAKDASKAVTVTGCLKAGEGTDSFLLSDLKWGKDKAVGTAGSATPAAPPISASSLKLVSSPGAKLDDHVGHTVEVSGTIGDKSDKPADPAARPSSSAPSLTVSNVKMISATCTP
jgi:hypothetical protein